MSVVFRRACLHSHPLPFSCFYPLRLSQVIVAPLARVQNGRDIHSHSNVFETVGRTIELQLAVIHFTTIDY
jgi:hypothetical protein